MVLEKVGAAEGWCCIRMVLQKDGSNLLQKDGGAEEWC